MVAPGATTMRLTIQVLPLAKENAHGPYRSRALEVFKGRKFAMPVRWDATFEQVWSQIEQRYVDNYLDAKQAANFTMKKLQDAYDCDLDLRDTVESIFAGETDPTMRMIKVVPSFLGRSFSVPYTSYLRPASAQKRARESNEEEANKRRRTGQLSDMGDEADLAQDNPVPSTENSEIGNHGQADLRAGSRARRSHTGASLVFVRDTQTGQAEFAPIVKEESPELGLSTPDRFRVPAKPASSAQTSKSNHRSTRTPSASRRISAQSGGTPRLRKKVVEPAPEGDTETQEEVMVPSVQADDDGVPEPEVAVAPEPGLEQQQEHIDQEPESDQESLLPEAPIETQPMQTRSKPRRRDIWEVPSSSPDFLHKTTTPKRTYARSDTTVRKEVDLLNSSRLKSARIQPDQPSCQSLEKRNEPAQPKKRGRPRLNPEQHATPSKPAKAKSSVSTSPVAAKKAAPRKAASPVVLIKTKGTTASKNAKAADAGAAQEDVEMGDVPGHEEAPLDSSVPSNPQTIRPEKDEAREVEPAAAAWNAESWGFENLGKPNGIAGNAEAPVQVDAHEKSPSQIQIAQEEAGNANVVVAPADDAGSLSGLDTDDPAEPEPAPVQDGESKSRSISAAVSTRSSPAVTRRPARFLTHSPSPEESGSEGESEEKSVPPQKPKSPDDAVEEISSDSDSDSTDTSSEDEEEDGDVAMTDTAIKSKSEIVVPSTAHDNLPSSPPKLNGAPNSTPMVPATSQPAPSQVIRRTPIPLPTKTPIPLPSTRSQTPRSSQSVSAQAATRRAAIKPQFRSLREQLADAKSPPVTTTKKAYDPRSMVLSKLANKKPGAAAALVDVDTDEDESSSSSDSD